MKKPPGCCVVCWSSKLKRFVRRISNARIWLVLVAGVLFCGLFSGCAPTTQRVKVSNVAAEIEARKQRQVALQAYLDDQKRLMRVSYPLLTKGSDLCGDDIRYTTGMALANSTTLLGEPFRETAETVYQLSDAVSVVFVVPGSASDKAGIRSGDIVTQVGTWQANGSGQTVIKSALDQIQVQTRNGEPLRIDVLRKGRGQSVLVIPDRSCSYPVVLGNGDEVNAYADGKQVIIQRGMMRFASNDTELGLVISHEIAHNSMSHMRSKMTNYALGSIVDIAAQIFLGIPTQGLFGNLGGNAYSQDFEAEADYVGLYIMAQSGGDIENAPQFWRRMATLAPGAIQSNHMSTHPATPERFVALEETVKEIRMKQRAGLPLIPNLKNAPDLAAEKLPAIEKNQTSP
jgi:Peptidase family M48